MTEYNGVYGDFEWEIVGRTLKVFSRQRRIGLLKVFENVNAINSEQAQWSAQGRIDLNLELLHELEAAKAAGALAGTRPDLPGAGQFRQTPGTKQSDTRGTCPTPTSCTRPTVDWRS